MNKEEFLKIKEDGEQRIKAVQAQVEKEINEARKIFIKENAPCEKGDIVTLKKRKSGELIENVKVDSFQILNKNEVMVEGYFLGSIKKYIYQPTDVIKN